MMFRDFVPGRVCLVGEHCDWACSLHPRSDALAIILPTVQGIHSLVGAFYKSSVDVTSWSDISFVAVSSCRDINKQDKLSVPLIQSELENIARSKGWWSYVAGTVSEIVSRYSLNETALENLRSNSSSIVDPQYINFVSSTCPVTIIFDITEMSLPLKKGYSSSAAVCVLVARAFNFLFGLHLSTGDIMELAYHGERKTGSLCGRMDQGLAAFIDISNPIQSPNDCQPSGPVLLHFDGINKNGALSSISKISLKNPVYLVVVDLNASKDTREILQSLNDCYSESALVGIDSKKIAISQQVQDFFSKDCYSLVKAVKDALESGDIPELGRLMTLFQHKFDSLVAPACPSQLSAPVLHNLLDFPELQALIYGGKGVGSQGDGAAQFVCKDFKSQQELIAIISRAFPQMCAFAINLQ